ncbi:MAG: hypothetical protein COT18_04330 [Elusimicrobia bacterium CG08_land_8_20_14_0_20_59_10]|nr:MAG: hypothetical protein COT18_04330 [Elusimicrobia bacterium CG08_land_8_20_14_0_20_59_10]
MRVLISYLPSLSAGKYIPISQQRFAKPRADEESIYPVILASGATQLLNNGFEVKYVDSVMRRHSMEDFLGIIAEFKPDLLVFETKTPVVKDNWKAVGMIKEKFPALKVAACGDHVSVLPDETMKNSLTDFVITGGDFDLGMLGIALHLRDRKDLPKGTYYREGAEIRNNGPYELLADLDSIPMINREIIPWQEYHEAWRLYPRFMYVMTGRGCPYRCTFCSWPQMLYNGRLRLRSVPNVIAELEELIKKYDVQELFIDTDTFTKPRVWVKDFCNEIIKRGIKVVWSCNGHVADVDEEMLALMRRAGCRMIKFGVESSSQKTLDIIRKGYTVEQVREAFKACRKTGVFTHATIMIGFYWETKKDMQATIDFVRGLDPYEVQFSVPIVYPGTALYAEARQKGWLRFNDGEWEKWDMLSPTMKNCELSEEEIEKLYLEAWKGTYFSWRFIFTRLAALRSLRDVSLALRGFKTLVKGHILARK